MLPVLFLVVVTVVRDDPGLLSRWTRLVDGRVDPDLGNGTTDGSGNAEARTVQVGDQTIVGDVRVLSFDEVRAEGGVEAAMRVAIEKYPERLRALLAEGVDPDLRLRYADGEEWDHPLEKAVRQGTRETFEILLEGGADVDGAGSDGRTALHEAAREGDLEVVEALLERGADPDRMARPHDFEEERARAEENGHPWEPHPGSLPIESAASRGHRDVVERLLREDVDLRYALYSAGWSGSVDVIDLLLEHGADARRRTAFDEGPLRGAAEKGHLSAVERLLAAGARPSVFTLSRAAAGGHDDVLRAFGAAGVDFDPQGRGWTPLHSAAHAGHLSTVKLLLELGATSHEVEGWGRPVDLARKEGHDDVVALLEAHG